jgi:CheY-like chemotaxis protein
MDFGDEIHISSKVIYAAFCDLILPLVARIGKLHTLIWLRNLNIGLIELGIITHSASDDSQDMQQHKLTQAEDVITGSFFVKQFIAGSETIVVDQSLSTSYNMSSQRIINT